MFEILKLYLDGLAHLFFPNLCICCEEEIPVKNNSLCMNCNASLPYLHGDNQAFKKHFWGRCDIHEATTLFIYKKGNLACKMIQRLKYKRDQNVGKEMGRLLAKKIKKTPNLENIDALIPVPIDLKKRRWRGYNQTEVICFAIAEVLQVPVYPNILEKKSTFSSLTKMDRMERIQQIQETISIKKQLPPSIKHILIVDDVLTTGATLESCINCFNREYVSLDISLATLAMSKNF